MTTVSTSHGTDMSRGRHEHGSCRAGQATSGSLPVTTSKAKPRTWESGEHYRCCRRWRYGGVTAAKALDEFVAVILIEPRGAFVHSVAILRQLVDPDWSGRLFFPYDYWPVAR